MPPRVSVIIPVYNRAHSVLPTLQSVKEQTFSDFECIVVDDGSSDGEQLRAVVEGLGDRRFRYLRRENGGASAARNSGIDAATGACIALLDSDDRWLREKLARDLAAGADHAVVFSPMRLERGGRLDGARPSRGPAPGETMADYLSCGQGFVPSSTVALPAALARSVRYAERLVFGDDVDFAVRLDGAGSDFVYLPAALAIMGDDETGDRLSRDADWRTALAWLDQLRPQIGERAYLCYRGWHVARMIAQSGDRATALRFYRAALTAGALSPKLAAKALAQIVLPHRRLRQMAGR